MTHDYFPELQQYSNLTGLLNFFFNLSWKVMKIALSEPLHSFNLSLKSSAFLPAFVYVITSYFSLLPSSSLFKCACNTLAKEIL